MIRILLVMFIVISCKPARIGGEAKFITVAQDDQERFVNGENILIKRVHEESWDILYGFDEDCPTNRKTEENYRMLRERIEKGVRVWLEPLREITNKPIVDKFIFHKTRDENIDLEITMAFLCEKGRSVASRSGRSISMRITPVETVELWFTPSLPYEVSVLIHELGHVFDLADTYVGNPNFSPPSSGGDRHTIGHQPPSVMSIGIGCEGRWSLCLDDKRAIQWLYRYHYEGLDPKNCPPEFIYEELTHEGKTVGGCVYGQPLLVTLRQGHLFYADELLINEKNLKINDKDKHGYSALHYLAPLHLDFYKGDVRLFLKKILEYPGIDVTVTDNYGNTPLHWSAWFGNADMVWFLLYTSINGKTERFETDINIRNKYGETALHYTSKLGRDKCTGYLLRRTDIDINIKEHRAGNTPLHEAAKNGHTEVVKALLAHDSINRNIRNRAGKTARQLAELNGHEETVWAFD